MTLAADAHRSNNGDWRLSPVVSAYVALICLVPVWYGSVGIWPWAIVAFAAGLLGVWTIADHATAHGGQLVPLSWFPVPCALMLAVVIWEALQCLSLMPESWHHPIWALAREALGNDLSGAITLNTGQSWFALLQTVTAMTVFWLALQLGRDRHNAQVFLKAIAWSVCLLSVYGLADLVFDWRMVLFTPKDPHVIAAHGNYASATFINRNHYAAFAGTGLIVLMALLMREVAHALDQPARSRKRQLAIIVSRLMVQGLPLMMMALPIIVGLVLSGSRAGLATTVVGMIVVFTLHALRASNKLGSAMCALLLLVAVVVLADSYGDSAARRLDTAGDAFSTRLAAYQITLKAALANPWLGYGGGTFTDLFPLFRDGSVGYGGIWNAAHNSYLEAMATLGFPAAVALLVAILIVAGRCLVGTIYRRRSVTAPIVAVAVSVQLGLHSAIDFPLQTGANLLLFAVVLGTGLSQSWSSRET